ncbi:O-antigen ligase family protein [Chamaesiphon sp. OTE_8_metabat_110]|uniref:O-antigen ligase family protein n=3 Tax=unclassified Chamaesiphon TaxID=2620921 RepID=UPI00286BD8B2|nr:O-antigen ligase family protein [Chamaesiphon sp. OTE_8_metabat_110]
MLKISSNEKTASQLETFVLCILFIALAEVILPPFSQLRPKAIAGLDKTLGSAVAQIGIYLFFILVLRNRFRDFFKNLTLLIRDPCLLFILVLTLLSALWSRSPSFTFKGSLVIVGTSLYAVHIAKHYSIARMTAILRFLCAVILIVGAIFCIVLPSFSVNEKGWQGIMSFPIRTGTFAALGIVLWLAHLISTRNQKSLSLGIIAIFLIVLVRSNSAQALLTLIALLGIFITQYLFKKLQAKQATVASVIFLAIGLCLFFVIESHTRGIFEALGKDTTLSGRTDFWPTVIATLNHHNPLLGFGVYGFWQPWQGDDNPARYIINANGFVPPNAHSGFLDLALEIGWLGLFLFACSFLKLTINAVRFAIESKTQTAFVPIILVAYIFISNFSETQLFSDVYIWFLYVFLATSPELN